MHIGLMISAAALAVAPAAMAQKADWRNAGAIGTGDAAALFMVDASSVTVVSGDVRQVLTATHFAQPRQFDSGVRYTAIRIAYNFDCRANTFQAQNANVWDGEKLVLSGGSPRAVNPVNADSPVAAVARAVCSGNFAALPRIRAATPNLEGLAHFGQ
ncbi:hypothetical protein P1X14_07260 [Sphingomonas sp. AOB5]|uniref:surface-adhesin E family protein n=1 Tax=Sphingomonas sp. AOB5 TaxID=3034017 RepID=UPI0023F8E090|nr:surface-adhesin E family protein [Sphingomonas sp. AOB5]MDF7775038.1 hypothetical protein [Sphingomonas sp. AOB5]